MSRRDSPAGTGRDACLEDARLSRCPDPAARWRDKRARRAAFDAWADSGEGLDALPAGLVSAMLGECERKSPGFKSRWGRSR
jgi:hypothetical protein